jgi:hypothetical protein
MKYCSLNNERRENGKSSAMGVDEMENILNNGRMETENILYYMRREDGKY